LEVPVSHLACVPVPSICAPCVMPHTHELSGSPLVAFSAG
jgi:hypothetical protein